MAPAAAAKVADRDQMNVVIVGHVDHGKSTVVGRLLADTDGKITEAYGAQMKGRKMSRRVSFLIDKNGKIVQVIDTMDATVQLAQMKDSVDKLTAK